MSFSTISTRVSVVMTGMVSMVTQEFDKSVQTKILCRIIFGSLCDNFGINDAIPYVLLGNKVGAFWSHICLLRHQIDMSQFFSNLFDMTIKISKNK